jgi:osmoprotectant transport system permease protein
MTILYKAPAKGPGGAARLLRYLGMPIFLGLACLALYLYIDSKDLDSIERRNLNANVITARLIEHVQLAAISTVIVVVLAVGVGILLTRPFARRVTTPIVGIANIGQAIPSIGLLAILAIIWTGGFWPAVVALVAYSFLSILRNTMVGLQQVDRSTIEAARGMGMTKTAVLFRIELPLAVPIILAGIRTALIINVGTAYADDVHGRRNFRRVDQQRPPSGPRGYGTGRRQRPDRHFGPVRRLAGKRG